MPRRDFSKVAFAATGDTNVIPSTTQPDGSISLPSGWGFDYQRDNGAGGGTPDPLAKNIEREDMNGILNEVTASIGEVQQQGFPIWVPTAAPYPINAFVRYLDKNWRSTVTNNNSGPGANTDWEEQNVVPTPKAGAVVGSTRNFKGFANASGSPGPFTADEVVVKNSLGGPSFLLTNVSANINLATVGAGGMDVGTPPISGYVAIYFIYNPTTQAVAVMAVNATASVAPSIYAGANMPSGYTASALMTVVGTNATGQFRTFRAHDRKVFSSLSPAYTSSVISSFVPFSLAGVIPRNAVDIYGEFSMRSTAVSDMTLGALDSTLLSQQILTSTVAANKEIASNFSGVPISPGTPQTALVVSASTAGTPTFNIFVGGYSI